MKQKQIEEMAQNLKLVADPTRLIILSCLKLREHCVCELVDILNISQPGVSQHLRKLKKVNIVIERRQGTWIYYRLNEEQPAYIQQVIHDLPMIHVETTSCNSTTVACERL